jgi:threonine dehydrogenase-like Zn-dependent dehydrogenase
VAARDAKQAIRAATGGGVDAVIEAVGADQTIALAISAARVGGRVSVIGVSQNKAFPLHLPAAQVRELEFAIGLCSVQYELPTLFALAAGGRLDPAVVVSHRLPLSEGERAYRMVASREGAVSKVVLDPTA